MAPKKNTIPATALPQEEELVELPEGSPDVPDPPFTFVIAHLFSHIFSLEVPAAAGEDPELKDFDPVEAFARCKAEPGELPGPISLATREDLEPLAEGGTLAAGLRRKVEAEAACLRRKKVNAARRLALPGERAEAEVEAEQERSKSMSIVSSPTAPDLTILVTGYPSTAEELEELASEGLLTVADAWISVHLAGESKADEPDDTGGTWRVTRTKGAPEILQELRNRILGAEDGSPFLSAAVTEVPNCHLWASPSEQEEAPDFAGQARAAILEALGNVAQQKAAYKDWCTALPEQRICIPDLPAREEEHDKPPVPTDLYDRMVAAVDSSHHDVPFLLYCLCEQVNHNLRGDAPEVLAGKKKHTPEQVMESAKKDFQSMSSFLDQASDLLLLGRDAPREDEEDVEPQGSLIDMVLKEEAAAQGHVEEKPYIPGMGPPPGVGAASSDTGDEYVIPYYDRVSCRHAGDRLSGGKSVMLELEQILSHLSAPGINRSDFPRRVQTDPAERSAFRNRIYKFLPGMSVVEIERMLILQEFQQLLHEAQPERQWDLKDRLLHEKIPAALLCQTLLEASCREYFVNLRYVDRQDCLLIAMHHRALPGRVLWHSWEGDLLGLTPGKFKNSQDLRVCPVPTFNDWWQHVSGHPSLQPGQDLRRSQSASREELPVASQHDAETQSFTSLSAKEALDLTRPLVPSKVLDMDAREVGYCRIVEKILVPSDRSVILRTAYQRGVGEAVPPLSEQTEVQSMSVASATGESFSKEQLSSATDEDEEVPPPEPFVPGPRRELRTVRVVKDALTFGMVTDGAWDETVAALKLTGPSKEETPEASKEEDDEAKQAEALRVAQGITHEDEEGAEPMEADEAPPTMEEAEDAGEDDAVNVTERFFEEAKFGCFWIVFQDGARCSIRMHHERLWYSPGDLSWDLSSSRPGVQVTYTPVSGVVIQAFSDASIRQNWPSQRLFPDVGREADDMLPGAAQDIELSRVVSAFGELVIERLSGRREVYHPSGTRAWRNPTVEELQERRDRYKARARARGCDVTAHACARRVAKICAAWEANQEEEEEMDPSEQSKYFGMPGHWRVTTRDGRRFGRTLKIADDEGSFIGSLKGSKSESAMEPDPLGTLPSKEAGVVGSKDSGKPGSKPSSKPPSKPGSKEVPTESKEPVPDAEEEEDLESEPEPPEPEPTLKDILEAVLVDEGANIEYELDPVPMLAQRDPHTGVKSISHEEGMLILVLPGGQSNVCLLPDGTRIINTGTEEGSEVTVESEGSARVTCFVKDRAYVPSSSVKVECVDGTTFQVVPQRLNLKAELVPSDPARFLAKLRGEPDKDAGTAPDKLNLAAAQLNSMKAHEFCRNPDPREDSYSTNASVLMRHSQGTLVNSKGAGEIELLPGADVAALGEKQALKTLPDSGCVYVAQVDYDRVYLRDESGNYFEVRGDQSVDFKLVVSMGDDFASPRCVLPQMPFKHPDASFLPLPEEAPPPRLFVVYGDGEAEELLLPRDVEETLRLAKQDPNALVVQGDPMGWPMSRCKTHSIHRILPMDPVSLQLRPLAMPPSIAGFDPPKRVHRSFTQFRQFIEYPALTQLQVQEWEAAYAAYCAQEVEQRQLQESLGAGLTKASRGNSVAHLATQVLPDDSAKETPDQAREGGA